MTQQHSHDGKTHHNDQSSPLLQTRQSLSNRLLETDMPMINKIGQIIYEVNNESVSDSTSSEQQSPPSLVTSLCQGMVYFKPPQPVLESLIKNQLEKSYHPSDPFSFIHNYCEHDFGRRAIREKLKEKLKKMNGIDGVEVVLTSGCNQAFTSVVLSLCDVGDECMVFGPYYFNHYMALQMFGVKPIVFDCREEDGYQPGCGDDMENFVDFFKKTVLNSKNKLKMVVVNTPCNPTGAVYTRNQLEVISQLCKENGIWLVMDETYEWFIYNDRTQSSTASTTRHYSPLGDHIIHLYSFSKCFAMPGWRIGYLTYPSNNSTLGLHLNKIQDTIVISSPLPSQQLALSVCEMDEEFGKVWAMERINTLKENRTIIWNAIHDLCNLEKIPEGAIYFWATLPNFANSSSSSSSSVTTTKSSLTDTSCSISSNIESDDEEKRLVQKEFQVIEWMVRKHKVGVLPGSCFGRVGGFRISYANVSEQACKLAATRLRKALEELKDGQFERDNTNNNHLYVKTFRTID